MSQNEISDKYFTPKLKASLRLIISVLERQLNNEWNKKGFQHILKMMFKVHNLPQTVTTYMLLTTSEEFSLELAHITCLMYFITLSKGAKAEMITEEEATPIFKKVYLLIETSITKKFCQNVMKLTHLIIKYWFLIRSRLPQSRHEDLKKEPLLFQNQLVGCQVLPVYLFLCKHFNYDCRPDDVDVMRDDYINKCCRQMCEYTLKVTYNYKNILEESNCDYKIAVKALHYILESRKYYVKDTAIVVFQSLVYHLNDVVFCLKRDQKQLELAKAEMNFFYTLIYATRELIELFGITWTDCMESVCVTNVAVDFICLTKWPSKVSGVLFVAKDYRVSKIYCSLWQKPSNCCSFL